MTVDILRIWLLMNQAKVKKCYMTFAVLERCSVDRAVDSFFHRSLSLVFTQRTLLYDTLPSGWLIPQSRILGQPLKQQDHPISVVCSTRTWGCAVPLRHIRSTGEDTPCPQRICTVTARYAVPIRRIISTDGTYHVPLRNAISTHNSYPR